MKKEAVEIKKWDSYPPFIDGPELPKKKLKREDFLFLSDEDFELFQKINDMPGEGPRIG
jgi:hypothetical protein